MHIKNNKCLHRLTIHTQVTHVINIVYINTNAHGSIKHAWLDKTYLLINKTTTQINICAH